MEPTITNSLLESKGFNIFKSGNDGFIFVQDKDDNSNLWAIFKEDGTQITEFIYENLEPYAYGYCVGEINLDNIDSKCYISEHEEPKAGDALIYLKKDSYSNEVACFIAEDGRILNNSYYDKIQEITDDGYRIYKLEFNAGRSRNDFRAGFLRPDGVLIEPKFKNIDTKYDKKQKKNLMVSNGVIRAESLRYIPRDEYGEYVGTEGIIDPDGNWVCADKYHNLTEFKNGIAKFYQQYKEDAYAFDWGYIDTKGVEYTPRFINGDVKMRDKDGNLGPIKNPGDILDLSDETRFLFDNGLYGYINKKGRVVVEPEYESAVYCFWGGLAFVKKNGLWGFIDSKGKPVTEFIFEHAGFISPGYGQGLIGNVMYLIGINGIISQKKNGYFGYRKKLTDNKTDVTRYSCGTFPQIAYDKMYFYDDTEWIFVDEFDYQIKDKTPSYTHFPAEWEYPHRADFLIHHEPSNTYYFKMGNKFGMDIHGNKIVIADLKEKISDVDTTEILQNFNTLYKGKDIPTLWKDLLSKGWAWAEATQGNADSPFSKSIILTNPEIGYVRDSLQYYDMDFEEITKKLYYLANADGTGAQYYYFLADENQALENSPIVFIGSEGEVDLVASNLNEFLSLLSIDTEPMGTQPDDEDIISYYKDVDTDSSTYLEDYIAWLKENDIVPILVNKELEEQSPKAKKIIRKANETYGKVWQNFLTQIGVL